MLANKPVPEMLDSIAAALEGTKTTMRHYLLKTLCEDPWEFLCRMATHCLAMDGLARCAECGTWTRDYCDTRLCPSCAETAGLAEVEIPFISTGHMHGSPVAPLTRTPLLSRLFDDLMDKLEIPVRSVTFCLEPNHEPRPSSPCQDALDEIGKEADPATATQDRLEPKEFASWATDKLFAAMEAEIAMGREELDEEKEKQT